MSALQRSQPLAIELADPTRDGITRLAARGYRGFRICLTRRHGQQAFRLGHLASGFAVERLSCSNAWRSLSVNRRRVSILRRVKGGLLQGFTPMLTRLTHYGK